jgi:transposase InsO family protein
MQSTPTIRPKKSGRQPLSPNGLDREMKRESKHRHRKKRKLKGSRRRTEMRKRRQDKLRRARRKQLRRRRLKEPLGRTIRRRVRAVRYYRHWRQRLSERDAAQRAASKYSVSESTIRRWDRLYRKGGLEALKPQFPGPKDVPFVVPLNIQFLIVALRRLLGWNEKRMSKELEQRGIRKVSHTTVGRIFVRYHLPTRTYHSRARCDGLPKKRYEKKMPNQQWHIDFAETHLEDGTRVVIIALTDDCSRYCLRCEVVADMTAETAIKTVQAAWQEFGLPAEIVSDNGRAFTSVYEGVPTSFGEVLRRKGIKHRLITPYYPEGNGKVEAFIKIVKHECLNRRFASLEELQQALAEFVTYYNHFRLHSSLGYQPPVTRYLGVEAIRNHGLAGIPFLPEELADAFSPSQPAEVPPVNVRTIKQRFALVPINC